MVLLGSGELKPCFTLRSESLEMTEVTILLVKLQHALVIFNMTVIILDHKPSTNFKLSQWILPSCRQAPHALARAWAPPLHPSN